MELHFWRKPVAVVGEERVEGLEVEHTELDAEGRLVGTGRRETLPAGMVVRSVGYASTPLPDRLAEIEQMERTLRDLINGLPEQEAQVIQSIYGIDRDGPMTLREVSEMLEVPHERVRQIRDKAIRHLRAHNFRAHLREHLEVCG